MNPTAPCNWQYRALNCPAEAVQREEAGVELYRELLSLVKDKSVVLEEYATRMVAAEAVHIREMELMLMKRAPD
jgi:rubrerythrin